LVWFSVHPHNNADTDNCGHNDNDLVVRKNPTKDMQCQAKAVTVDVQHIQVLLQQTISAVCSAVCCHTPITEQQRVLDVAEPEQLKHGSSVAMQQAILVLLLLCATSAYFIDFKLSMLAQTRFPHFRRIPTLRRHLSSDSTSCFYTSDFLAACRRLKIDPKRTKFENIQSRFQDLRWWQANQSITRIFSSS
jgi:hypothetical protein